MENKDAYTRKAEARVREWTAEIEKLKAKADQAQADAEIGLEKDIEELYRRRDAVLLKLEGFKNVGGAAWNDLKIGLDNALADLKLGLDNAVAKFK